MGVSIECKKTGRSIDMGYGGFGRLRQRVAELVDKDIGEHFAKLQSADFYRLYLNENARNEFFEKFNAYTARMIRDGRWNPKIIDFLCQTDCGGKIHYGACKLILQAVDGCEDNEIYGYAALEHPATMKLFAEILKDCVATKSDLIWG